MPRSIATLAALAALLLSVGTVALAGNAPKASSSALSPSALGMDSPNSDKADAVKPDVKIPDNIKFGDRTLSFEADRKPADSIPRVGLDAADPEILPKSKDQDLPPAYFGLKLTIPTH